jgi:hypothetical protein
MKDEDIVMDLFKALLGNGSVNMCQHTRGQQYSTSDFYVVHTMPSARQRSCEQASLTEEGVSM